VEQCGNGARCFVQFVHERGLALKRELRVETRGGIIVPRREDDGEVTVVMGVPRFKPSELPFLTESEALVQPLQVDGETAYITALSMGNPHAVQVVADVDAAPVTTQGAAIERHPRFPNRVNAGYLQVLDPQHIRLRVYERGAGETLSCGTGACAAAVAGILRGLLVSPVRVTTPGGDLRIAWDGAGKPVMLTGPATTVYHGEIEI
jgi:diaminopimelate epimerase